MAMRQTNPKVALILSVLLFSAVCGSLARQVPGQLASSQQQQRSLLADTRVHHANKQQHAAAAHQLDDEVAGSPPPFVSAAVPRSHAQAQQQLPHGPPVNLAQQGAVARTGGANWLNYAGIGVGVVDYGVGLGTALAAPIVNGVASNIPLLAPTLPDGRCLRGGPIFLPRLNRVMCVVGNGAQVTNYMFHAANVLANAATASVNLAARITAVATGR